MSATHLERLARILTKPQNLYANQIYPSQMKPYHIDVEEIPDDLSSLLKDFYSRYPHFPDGRIDYTNASSAAVLDCFVRYMGKILLLERSDKVGLNKNRWSMIMGYLDEPDKSLLEKALIEIEEETGISQNHIVSHCLGKPFKRVKGVGGKTWYVYTILVDLDSQQPIKLDWEHTSYS